MINLALEQGIAHIKTIVSHLHIKTNLTPTMIQILETIQITSGLFCPILEHNKTISYIHAPWINTTLDMLQ